MLANDLTAMRTQLFAVEEGWKEKERVARMEQEEMINNLKNKIASL
jgi:hypothetical protein